MKKLLILTMAITLVASGASATVLVSDDFSYPDGSLVGNGLWANHSGTPGDLLVASGQAVITHGAPSEDVNVPFVVGSGMVFFAFDFSVDDLGAPYSGGTDFEYFAHFKDDGFAFRARMDIVAPSGSGDFSVGISSIASTADATWPTDMTYNVVYHAIVMYDQDKNFAQLWIDGTFATDPSIIGTDQPDPGTPITQFALRQSDSTVNETVRVDNLIVSDACDDVFSGDCQTVATEAQSWGNVKSLYR